MRISFALAAVALSTGALAEDIVIGQSLPLSGPSAAIARELQRGREACVQLVNAQGGIRGKTFKLLTRDDGGEPAKAVEAARELVQREGAVALFGSMGPGVNSALLQWAGGAGAAVIGPYGGDIEVRNQDSGSAFFLTANQSAEAERLASHVSSLGLSRVVIVHAQDRAGAATLTALEEGLGVSNVAPVAIVAVRGDGSDASEAVQGVAAAKAQAVLLATSGRTTIAVLKALATSERGSLPLLQVYGLSSAASPTELLELKNLARGFSMTQVLPLPRDARVPLVATFLAAMRNAPGDRTYAELEGCVAPLLLAEVLRRKPAEPTRATVLQALRAAAKVNLGGFEIDLGDRTRPGSRFTDIVFVGSDGRLLR
ncbi:ABC transporter substrate-binding protein [Ideonella sp.]|uniref:ABC transporter substrate-binding protein n=1 Tax=Ideonella sp. TaxID=1929293 RepID=UPI002B4911C4|nr:ABC transporter substrate-binding protein [Ideonella sp.]HJV71700.1 ABC transporter substrate-binding protein [Ideonella sp.]